MNKKINWLKKISYQKQNAIAAILKESISSKSDTYSKFPKTAKISEQEIASAADARLAEKNILIVLWFRSLVDGGLHENVYDTVKFIKSAGGNAIIVCPASNLSKLLISESNTVYETNFEDLPSLAENIISHHPNLSLIHVHPGKARQLGEIIHKRINAPIVITIHGKWFDGIDKNNKIYSRVLGVSEYITQLIRDKSSVGRHRIITMENAFDESCFYPKSTFKSKKAIFCGRLDNDKRASIELLYSLWEKQAKGELPIFSWAVAGDGPLREEMQAKAVSIFLGVTQLVHFLGWQTRQQLSALYQSSMFMIGAGRSSLEALACACPIIACSNELETAAPIYNFNSYLDVAYSNFGGFGSTHQENTMSNVSDFIINIIKDFNAFGKTYLKIAQHLNKTRSEYSISEKTINCYLDVFNENS